MNGANYKKENIIILSFIILNLTVLLIGSWFLTTQIMSSSSQLAEKRGEIEATEKSWDEISRNQKDLQSMDPQLTKIDEAFVPKDEPIEFINLLESLAQKTENVFDISLLTLGSEAAQTENVLLFQIRLTGNYVNLMHFLNYLENMKYLVQAQTLSITAAGASVSQSAGGEQIISNNVSSTINIKVFTK